MRDAVGGVPIIAFIMFFIAIVSGYIAFTINYSKAFKVKSKLIDEITTSVNANGNNKIDIEELMKDNDFKKRTATITSGLAYNASSEYTNTCEKNGYSKVVAGQGWCYEIVKDENPEFTRKYVKITTFVVIDIPIFNKIFPNLRLFHVEGSTPTYEYINK